MIQVKIKRVYEPAEAADGYRVLVDKLWPRGVSKSSFHYDLWAKDIAPSTALRQWYHAQADTRWQEFREKYIRELKNSTAVNDFISRIQGQKVVTLLFASRNAAENHALVLKEFMEGNPEKVMSGFPD